MKFKDFQSRLHLQVFIPRRIDPKRVNKISVSEIREDVRPPHPAHRLSMMMFFSPPRKGEQINKMRLPPLHGGKTNQKPVEFKALKINKVEVNQISGKQIRNKSLMDIPPASRIEGRIAVKKVSVTRPPSQGRERAFIIKASSELTKFLHRPKQPYPNLFLY
jgi:hypothetical protein